MRKITFRGIIFIILLMLNITSHAQDDLIQGVTIHEDEAADGYIFFAPITSQTAYLIDYHGNVIREWVSEHSIFAAYSLGDGTVLMATRSGQGGGGTGHIEQRDWENNLIWEFDYPDLHHDIEVLPNGNLLMLAWERFPRDEILAMGLNPENLADQGTTNNRSEDYDGLFLDSIIEVNPSTNEIVWRWSVSDHLVQDYDSNAPNYGKVADFPRRINLNYSNQRLPFDRVHLNSLDYNVEHEQIAVVAHYYSEIWIIDHSLSTEETATEAGDLLYRFGNPQTYGQGTLVEQRLYLPHDAHWVNTSQMIVFNNGRRNLRPFSTIDRLILPEPQNYISDEGFAPTELQLLYSSEPPEDFFAMSLSGAELLPENHLLITDGPAGRIFEVDANGEIVWEYLQPFYQIPDTDSRAPIFKAHYFSADGIEFMNND